jgi:hypothetical protein
VDSDGYGFLVGKYLGPKTLLELHADRSDERRETSSFACFPLTACVVLGSIETRRTTDVLAVDARHVRRFRGLTYSLSGSVAETNTDYEVHQSLVSPFPTIPIRLPPGAVFTPVGGVVAVPLSTDFSLGRYRSYAAAVDFYPTAKIGAHAGYSRYDGDLPPAEDAYDVGATWFVARHVGLRFGFARQRAPKGFAFGDVDTATLGVTGRF